MRNLSSYVNSAYPQTSSVANLVALISGIDPVTGLNVIPTITPAVRLWHQDTVTPLNLANPANPNDANEICGGGIGAGADVQQGGYVRAATVDHTLSGDVHRTFNFTFSQLLATQVQTLTAIAQPFIQYRDANKIDPDTGKPTVLVEFSQGMYMFEVAERALLSPGDVYKVVGHDLTQLVANVDFESPYVLPADVNLVDAWIAALAADKLSPGDAVFGLAPRIPSGVYPYWNFPGTTPCGCCDNPGPNFPSDRIHITPNPMTAIQTIPFYTEANQIALGKTCAKLLSYEDLWALDNHVYARPLPYSTDTPVVPEFTCNTGNTSMIKAVNQRAVDYTKLKNEITAISANNTLTEPLVATRKNFSADSNISVPNLGYVLSDHIQDDRLLTQEQVDMLAFVALNEAALADEPIEVEMGLPLPHLTNNDALGLNVYSKDGKTIEVDASYYPFLVTAWHLDLQTMTQNITAGRLVTL